MGVEDSDAIFSACRKIKVEREDRFPMSKGMKQLLNSCEPVLSHVSVEMTAAILLPVYFKP